MIDDDRVWAMSKLWRTGVGVVGEGDSTEIIEEGMRPRPHIVKVYGNTENRKRYKTGERKIALSTSSSLDMTSSNKSIEPENNKYMNHYYLCPISLTFRANTSTSLRRFAVLSNDSKSCSDSALPHEVFELT